MGKGGLKGTGSSQGGNVVLMQLWHSVSVGMLEREG